MKMATLIDSIAMGPFGSDVKVEYMVRQGVPFLDGSNLISVRMNDKSLKYVTREKANSLRNALVHPFDIVVTHRGTLGQLSYVPDDLKYDEFLISQSQFKVSLDLDQVDPIYFAYYFHTSEGQKRLLSFANYVGVPALAAATTNFKELEFPLIPLVHQRLIAKLLSSIDEKIRNNNAICSDIDAMAKILYDYWFVQFDFPDENGRPYKSSGGKMVWNDALNRAIPEGWEISRIGELVSTERGISYSTPNIKTGNGQPMLNLATFMPGSGKYKSEGLKHYQGDYAKSKVLHPYDLIMCNTQQTAIKFETDIIGRATLVPDIFGDDDIVFSHHVNVIRTGIDGLKEYLLFLFDSDYFHKYISGFTNGTNILSLMFSGVEDYLIEIPERTILLRFSKIVLDFEKQKSLIISENQQLTELRDFLLPLLMNGQVTIRTEDAEEALGPRLHNDTWHDERFSLWFENGGLAARGNIDRQTLREIFDAMDEDDK